MNDTQRFFYTHAGYSYDPVKETAEQGRTRGAKQLAKAERQAFMRGFFYRWYVDPDCDSSEFSEETPPWHLWQVAMFNRQGRLAGRAIRATIHTAGL